MNDDMKFFCGLKISPSSTLDAGVVALECLHEEHHGAIHGHVYAVLLGQGDDAAVDVVHLADPLGEDVHAHAALVGLVRGDHLVQALATLFHGDLQALGGGDRERLLDNDVGQPVGVGPAVDVPVGEVGERREGRDHAVVDRL